MRTGLAIIICWLDLHTVDTVFAVKRNGLWRKKCAFEQSKRFPETFSQFASYDSFVTPFNSIISNILPATHNYLPLHRGDSKRRLKEAIIDYKKMLNLADKIELHCKSFMFQGATRRRTGILPLSAAPPTAPWQHCRLATYL